MSRGHVYNHISCFQYQPYIDILTIDKFRISLTEIRVSSHRLTIVTMQMRKINVISRNERLCNECNTVEDEYHCDVNVVYMLIYVVHIYMLIGLRPNMFKCIELLRTENTYTVKRLSTFIFKALELRNTIICRI